MRFRCLGFSEVMVALQLATEAGLQVTTYPCHDGIVDDLQDAKAGRMRPFNPKCACSSHKARLSYNVIRELRLSSGLGPLTGFE